jgi:flavin-binding protein dodecin
MNGHVYGLSEIVGTSEQGVDDAIRVGVERPAGTVRGLDWFEVTDIRGAPCQRRDRTLPSHHEDRIPDGGSPIELTP